jgi:hypothetical protein
MPFRAIKVPQMSGKCEGRKSLDHYRARDQLRPLIEVRRRHYHGDPRLPVVEISMRLAA